MEKICLEGRIVTSYQRLQQFFDDFTAKIKNARAEQGLTNQALSDQSGVSYSTVCKISADTQDNPKVSDAIALIDTLGLSADEVFGLQPAYEREVLLQRIRELTAENERLANGTEQLSNQRDRVHKLELENVRLQGEVNRLNAINDGLVREKGRLTSKSRWGTTSLWTSIWATRGLSSLVSSVYMRLCSFLFLSSGLVQSHG